MSATSVFSVVHTLRQNHHGDTEVAQRTTSDETRPYRAGNRNQCVLDPWLESNAKNAPAIHFLHLKSSAVVIDRRCCYQQTMNLRASANSDATKKPFAKTRKKTSRI